MTSVNLSALPEVHFADADAAQIEAAVMSAYEKASGVTLQPGDPVRLFLESLSYLLSVQNSLIDLAGRQNLLAYAQGAALDHLGALMGVARIPAQPARCELRFALGEALDFAVPIPEGTRVAGEDGRIAFATEYPARIEPGQTSVDVAALCTEAGPEASGLLPGQIARLVDPLPWVVSAQNVTSTYDGAAVEDDERLRGRIRLAPESFTVAGSSGAYEARTLEVSSEISAVAVTSPEPGAVDVRFVLAGGELPDQAMTDMVREALSASDVRPLTDTVTVGAPDVVSYSIRGRWYLREEDTALASGITSSISSALEDFRLWQRGAPGRDINPSRLVGALIRAGAKRVELDGPAFTRLTPTQIAREDEIELVFGGVEDE